jgi:hypothetical protein
MVACPCRAGPGGADPGDGGVGVVEPTGGVHQGGVRRHDQAPHARPRKVGMRDVIPLGYGRLQAPLVGPTKSEATGWTYRVLGLVTAVLSLRRLAVLDWFADDLILPGAATGVVT